MAYSKQQVLTEKLLVYELASLIIRPGYNSPHHVHHVVGRSPRSTVTGAEAHTFEGVRIRSLIHPFGFFY